MSNWNEALHPRVPAGSPEGGEFTRGPRFDFSEPSTAAIKAEIEKQLEKLGVARAYVTYYDRNAPEVRKLSEPGVAYNGIFFAGKEGKLSEFAFTPALIKLQDVEKTVLHEVGHAKFNQILRYSGGKKFEAMINANARAVEREAPLVSKYAASQWPTYINRFHAVNEAIAESYGKKKVPPTIGRLRALVDKAWNPSKPF